jgi:hypothetical protein
MFPSVDERPPRCSICRPKVSGFHFCRHLVDPESRLYLLLTHAKHWDHFKTMQALDAYADFLTLKVLEKDYDDTLLLPTDIIDEVNGDWRAMDINFCSVKILHVVIRCGARTASRPSSTSPAWTASLTASTFTTSRRTP